jgi:ribosomal protein S18 acetylase RimI-like enzyme
MSVSNALHTRKASEEDISLIRELCMQVWPATYSSILTPEQIDYMLEWMYSPSSLKEQLNKGAIFWILYKGEEPIGYSSFENIGVKHYKLHKLYVLPKYQGEGAGGYLLSNIIQHIKDLGGHSLELQVNRFNKAVGFYRQLGFYIREEADFHIGNGYYMNDFIMQIDLV